MLFMSKRMPPEIKPVTGMVNNQVASISPATPHLTMFTRWADPAPRTAELITCVEETGPPISAAPKTTKAEDTCEQKP